MRFNYWIDFIFFHSFSFSYTGFGYDGDCFNSRSVMKIYISPKTEKRNKKCYCGWIDDHFGKNPYIIYNFIYIYRKDTFVLWQKFHTFAMSLLMSLLSQYECTATIPSYNNYPFFQRCSHHLLHIHILISFGRISMSFNSSG